MLTKSEHPPRRVLADAIFNASTRIAVLSTHVSLLSSFQETTPSEAIRIASESELVSRLAQCATEVVELARVASCLAEDRLRSDPTGEVSQ